MGVGSPEHGTAPRTDQPRRQVRRTKRGAFEAPRSDTTSPSMSQTAAAETASLVPVQIVRISESRPRTDKLVAASRGRRLSRGLLHA